MRDFVPFLRDFTEPELRTFLSYVKPVRKSAGNFLYFKGDVPDSFHLIISGEVEICVEGRSTTQTKEHVIATLKAGDIVGEMGFALKTGKKHVPHRTASAKAKTNVLLFEISDKIFETTPHMLLVVYKNLCKVLAMKLVESNKKLKESMHY